jgi:3-hydroxyacyl-CoA dehydrogenase
VLIRKIGVVGAGTMGGGIAALAASAGIPVVLLDIPGGDGRDRGAPARLGLDRQLKAKPAAFMDPDRAHLIRTGNTDDDLALLADCDWIVEAILEQPAPKRALFARLDGIVTPTAIVTSNTSGIPMRVLAEGRSGRRFLGTHFFSPVRYMHLLEVIPAPDTAPETLDAVRAFAERTLGKGVVIAKDAPGFIANRLGVKDTVTALRQMAVDGLTIDDVDALTGPLIGRPSSATFRTGDIAGIDVLAHVAAGLADATGEDFALPAWVHAMVAARRLGDKTGGGYYEKRGRDIFTYDPATGQYAPRRKPGDPALARLAKLPLPDRVRGALALPGKYGHFLRNTLFRSLHYTLATGPELAHDPVAIDRAMEWGYGHDAGPFRIMDMIGADALARGFKDLGLDTPTGFAGWTRPAPRPSTVLDENKGARLLDIGDGVAQLEFRSKMNTLGDDVLTMLARSLERIDRDGRVGLVIGNDDPRAFSAGANLAEGAAAAQAGDGKALEARVQHFQDSVLSIRRAPFPVVVAAHGLTLGGGCELALHADAVQAHAELYMGLVEVGVGLIPAGGGTKELLFRFMADLDPYAEADPFEAVRRAFQLIAMAQTSTSALDARRKGFLRPSDRITMNRDLLIADAKRRVLDLAPDYVPPAPRTIRALGRDGIGNLNYALFAFQESGQATPHDVRIGRELANVLSGGNCPPHPATEQDILDLEREAILRLLGTAQTQQRITHMLSKND